MSAGWKQRPEGGGWFAIWLIRGFARHGGRALARAALFPITLYFLIRRGAERRASRAYLSRALGRPARLPDVARHIHCFAATILDRVFLLSGQMQRFDLRVHGLDALRAQHEGGRGVLLFGSHLGSFEALRVLARGHGEVQLRVVLDVAHNPAMTQLLDALSPEVAATVIDAGQEGPSLMLAIGQAVADGAIVALLVDRVQPGEPWQPVSFLGRDAALPLAPWRIAAALGAPVLLAFGLYRGGNRYDLHFEPCSDGGPVPRPQRARWQAALIRGYAARLEHHARQAPYNWFNFYDYWDLPDAPTPTCSSPAVTSTAGDAAAGRQPRTPARSA